MPPPLPLSVALSAAAAEFLCLAAAFPRRRSPLLSSPGGNADNLAVVLNSSGTAGVPQLDKATEKWAKKIIS